MAIRRTPTRFERKIRTDFLAPGTNGLITQRGTRGRYSDGSLCQSRDKSLDSEELFRRLLSFGQ